MDLLFAHAEVRQLDVTVLVEQHVVQLQVSAQQSNFVFFVNLSSNATVLLLLLVMMMLYYAVVTTIQLRLDGRSTVVRLLIKGH